MPLAVGRLLTTSAASCRAISRLVALRRSRCGSACRTGHHGHRRNGSSLPAQPSATKKGAKGKAAKKGGGPTPKGKLAPLGFEEDLVDLAPAPEGTDDDTEQDPGAFWKEFIRETSPEFRKPTVDQLETFIAPTFQALIDGVLMRGPSHIGVALRTADGGIAVTSDRRVAAIPAMPPR